jgi:hypothetical protein
MMTIVCLLCAAGAPERCETHVADFRPAIPVTCVIAEGPELARRVPEGSHIADGSCAEGTPETTIATSEPDNR